MRGDFRRGWHAVVVAIIIGGAAALAACGGGDEGESSSDGGEQPTQPGQPGGEKSLAFDCKVITAAEVSEIFGSDVKKDADCGFSQAGASKGITGVEIVFRNYDHTTREEIDQIKSEGSLDLEGAKPSDLKQLPTVGEASYCFAGQYEEVGASDTFYSGSGVLVDDTLGQANVTVHSYAQDFSSFSVERMTDMCKDFQELIVSKSQE